MNLFEFGKFIKGGGGTGGKKLIDVTIETFGALAQAGAGEKLPGGFSALQTSFALTQAISNQNNAFSYKHPLIAPNGIYEKLSEGQIEYYQGQNLESSTSSDPFLESLGSRMCYDASSDNEPAMARLTFNQGFFPAGFNTVGDVTTLGSNIVPGKIYPLPLSYYDSGLKKISFSNLTKRTLNTNQSNKYFGGLLGGKTREYVFLWGNINATQGMPDSNYAVQFAKLKLVFLSLMMTIKQKKEGFIYKYPIFDPANPNSSNSNTLMPKYQGSQFDFDNLIDNNNEFLESIASSTGYQRRLYAIAYQLMIGQSGAELGSPALLSEGIEKKTFYYANHNSQIPISEEVSPILGDLGSVDASTLIADIKPSYNYTIPYYEKAAPQIPEIRLPNIYRSLMIDGIDNFGELYMADPYGTNYNQDPQSDDNYSYNDSLYENIANSFIICGETEKSVYEDTKYTSMMNIVLDPDFFHNNPILDQADLLKDQLPMYVEVSFQTETRSSKFDTFVKTLADYNIIKHYIQTYIRHGGPKTNAASIVDEKTNGATSYIDIEEMKKSFEFLDSYGLYHPLSYQAITRFKDPAEINLYDQDFTRTILSDSLTTNFGKWFQMYVKAAGENYNLGMTLPWYIFESMLGADQPTGPVMGETPIAKLFDILSPNETNNNLTYMLHSNPEIAPGSSVEIFEVPSYVNSYSLPVVQPEVEQMFEDEKIKYSQMNSGKTSKSVTLFYEIKKYAGSENIQNIFVQNKFGKQQVKYIDTQVKYGVSYTYRIIAHKLVFSSDYKITFANTDVTDKMATQLGYSKKQSLDILYSAILDQNNNKVGDYFNSPIFNPFSGPVYASLAAAPSTTAINNLLVAINEQEDQIPYTGASVEDSFFDVTGVEQGQDPGQTGQVYVWTDGVGTKLSTYRAYTQTDKFPSKEDTLFDIKGNDLNNADKNAYFKKTEDLVGDNTDAVADGLYGSKELSKFGAAYVSDEAISIDGENYVFTTGEQEVCDISEPPFSNPSLADVDSTATPDIGEKLFIFEVDTFPNPIVSKVPYYAESDVVVMDDPPVYPNVTFCPFAKEKKKLMITFENQGGMREEVPINLMPQDLAIFNAIRNSQKKMYTYQNGSLIDNTLRFKNDDFAAEYQVFRISFEPSSYDSFYGQLYRTLNVAEQTAINEFLETNVKYYYTFRTVDNHGKVSNPTPVYQVEMVEDAGLIYPVINVFDMFEKNKLNKEKQFDRFLKIEAAYAQKVLNLEKSNIESSGEFKDNFKPILGVLDESLWNDKKFKFRLKAKNSCKVIDLNVNFVTKHTDTDNGPKTCN